jgi:hypothetical protein
VGAATRAEVPVGGEGHRHGPAHCRARARGGPLGCVLALLKYPFYPLFNFDNDMNLMSKSLTILTSVQLSCTSTLQ